MAPVNFNPLVDPLLTDLYQLTMVYGYWKNRIHEKPAVFDLFFRRCPFGGEFAVFAGLEQVLCHLDKFRITNAHVKYLHTLPEFANVEPAFFDWLQSLDCSRIRLHAQAEGNLAFPRVPLLRVEGPLAVAQLLETTLLTLVNYPSLVATNAARYRLAAGWDKTLLEFGLRRAQGPDGGTSASQYSWLGGFDATSNVKAGELFGIPVAGTHAHAFVEAFTGFADLESRELTDAWGKKRDLQDEVLAWQSRLGFPPGNTGELAAFTAYALAFPAQFVALVDTYSTLESGIPNFLCVACALFDAGYFPRGIRLDSGDLAYLSRKARDLFLQAEAKTGFAFSRCRVTASNDLNEGILHSLRHQDHAIDNFGIGTNLVTCEAQPAFGGVYKLVEIGGQPRIKLSENPVKITLPGKKNAFRLYGQTGEALADILVGSEEEAPRTGKPILCRHPSESGSRVMVVPFLVEDLLPCVWDGRRTGEAIPLKQQRERLLGQLRSTLRPDILRHDNPARYKVSLSEALFTKTQALIEEERQLKTLE